MSALNRKLWRDLSGNAGLLATVLAIIAVGTGSFIGLISAQRILEASQRAYYRDYRFADFWIDVKKAPVPQVERLGRLPGIDTIQPRIVYNVILDLPDTLQPIRGRLISMPAGRASSVLNGICIVRGTTFSQDRTKELILGDAFARAHGLRPGDAIHLLLNRRRERFLIAGTALSPEYVYMVSGQGDFTPDPEHFGILYLRERVARDMLDFQGACNQIVGRFRTGDPDQQAALLDRMERILDPFGVIEVTPRRRQASHRFLSDEIRGLGITAAVMPTIFLIVAALVLNLLMTRLAERQRTVIGTLKALGYSNRRVLAHFLSFGGIVGVLGGLAGIGLGVLLTKGLMALYPRFFEFPKFLIRPYPGVWLLGMVISIAFAVAGSVRGAWRVLKLAPAEAMRPFRPARGGAILLERVGWLWRRLDFRTHIALRSVFRNRVRTLSAIFASAIATAMILMTLMMRDSLLYLVEFQFDQVSRSDVDLGFREERSRAALYEVRNLPGVTMAETLFGLACDLRNGPYARRVAVTGLPCDHQLTVPRARDLEPIEIPSRGLVLSNRLARTLHVSEGDPLFLRPARGRRDLRTTFVASTVAGYLGLECYADQEYLSGLVGETEAINAAQLVVDPLQQADLYRAVKRLPDVQSIGLRSNTREAIESTFIETMKFSLTTMILMAGVIAFGTTLNTTRVELADREREVATFRAFGYQPRQIAAIFVRQNLIVFVVGLVLGLPLGYGLVLVTARAYDTDLFRMPVVVYLSTLLSAAALSLVFVLVAQAFVYRQILRLDWRSAIYVRE